VNLGARQLIRPRNVTADRPNHTAPHALLQKVPHLQIRRFETSIWVGGVGFLLFDLLVRVITSELCLAACSHAEVEASMIYIELVPLFYPK
jgi:hypothetical protein